MFLQDGDTAGRSIYRLANYRTNGGWGKLPARRLYSGDHIAAFEEFYLRRPVELTALKLYLLFVARRNDDTNLAHISYDTINDYAAIDQSRIKSGLSVLAAQGLIHVEHRPSSVSNFGISNAYRLAHIDPHRHMGTTGRSLEFGDYVDLS